MISLRDVVTGFGARDPLAEVWRRSLRGGGGGAAEITGVPPLRYIGDGRPLTDYLISGNAVQDGTPSADAPVDATGCGVRTGNMWQNWESYSNKGVTVTKRSDGLHFSGTCTGEANISVTAVLKAGTYTLSANANRMPADNAYPCLQLYNAGTITEQVSNHDAVSGSTTFTVASDVSDLQYRIRIMTGINYDGFILRPMLNLGSTALPYEPYGFKLPLTVNGTEYPIYLGQVETTRRIKKLVLDGTESSWGSGTSSVYLPTAGDANAMLQFSTVVSSHYAYHYGGTSSAPNNSVYTNAGAGTAIWFKTDYGNDVNSFKAFLAQEYAAGHPVTVWYVLAKPETAIVNEPLMKIGDYADTISFAQSQVDIPTVNGANVLDVPTEVPPSQITIKGGIRDV